MEKTKAARKGLLTGGICAGMLAVLLIIICLLPGRQAEAPTDPQEETTLGATVVPTENPLKPEDFAYQGEYLACLNMPARLGVDVSVWQGDIDWQQVSQAGMEFAMIRLGYRGTTKGGLGADDYAKTNYEKANALVGGVHRCCSRYRRS